MTKPVKKWPGELGKPIRRLPINMMTHGGRITGKTLEAYNTDASANIDKALNKVRLSKIPLLAQYYGVGSQNYAGLAKAIATEFIRKFKGDLNALQKDYDAADNKALAMFLAIQFVKGFSYQPLIIKPQYSKPFCSDAVPKETLYQSWGFMKGDLADGRPERWTEDLLVTLVEDTEKTKKTYQYSADTDALKFLQRRDAYHGLSISILQTRLAEGRKLKKPSKA